jgi:hypothetical protein
MPRAYYIISGLIILIDLVALILAEITEKSFLRWGFMPCGIEAGSIYLKYSPFTSMAYNVKKCLVESLRNCKAPAYGWARIKKGGLHSLHN